MTHEAKPIPLADASKATIYLLTGKREGKLTIAVSLQEMRRLHECPVTGVTTRTGVDLERLLTNARGLALEYLSLLIDQFQGTESFLPRLISFTAMALELLAKEDIDTLRQLASEELTRALGMLDEAPLSADDEASLERLLARFRNGSGNGNGTGAGEGGAA